MKRSFRSALMFVLLLALLLPSLGLPAVRADEDNSHDVPMFRGNPARTGEMPGPGPDPNQEIMALWAFPSGASIESSPAVVDGVVYVGSEDGNLYAVDAASGQVILAFGTSSYIDSSPTVADGVVYVGSDDGILYAIGNPTVAMATATAQAQQAQLLQQSWDTYFLDIGTTLSASVSELPGVTVAPDSSELCGNYHRAFPIGDQGCRVYPVQVAGSSGGSWVALSIFGSKEAADDRLADMNGGLLRSGWQQMDVDGLAHNHACLTIVQDQTSIAECLMTRDDALIVSYSYLDVVAPDAVLLNATDLARLMSDAYDQVDRPASIGFISRDMQ